MNDRSAPDASAPHFPDPSHEEWRQQVLNLARDGQSEFTALLPTETGLPMTVYASERDDYLALVVDSQPGPNYAPSPGSRAYEIGDRTGDRIVDRWTAQNVEALRYYANGKFDTIEFYKRMRPIQSRVIFLMPNYQRGRFNAPLAFFIQAEGPGTQHNARVKVNVNYNLGYDRTGNFSIQILCRP